MSIQAYWSLTGSDQAEVFKHVIIPLAWCEECHTECSQDGFLCYWCDCSLCPAHALAEKLSFEREVKTCKDCQEWENWSDDQDKDE